MSRPTSRPTLRPQPGLILFTLLALLALALMAAPHPTAGGAFGQPAASSSVSLPQSVFAPRP